MEPPDEGRAAGLNRWLNARHAEIIENLPDVVWTADANGRAVYISPRVEQVLGFSPEEVYRDRDTIWIGRIHPDHLHEVWDAYRGLFGDPSQPFDVLYLYQHKDGRWVWIHDRALTTWERDGIRYTDGAMTDITAIRSLAEELRHSQKMEAVGRLAAGIAHDFNNLVTAILGYADLVLDDLTGGTPLRQHVEEIQRAARRAAALTRELLVFSRKQVLELAELDVPALVAGMSDMLQRAVGDTIEVRVTRPGWSAHVRVDKGRFEQVIMNLAMNAKDAMPGGGRLTFDFRRFAASEARPAGVEPGPHLVMSVIDTGAGMDGRTRARIFEPFFTTKEPGKGTGLSTAYGVIKQIGGHITIWSAVGRGSQFDVYLPLAAGAVIASGA